MVVKSDGFGVCVTNRIGCGRWAEAAAAIIATSNPTRSVADGRAIFMIWTPPELRERKKRYRETTIRFVARITPFR
jgi:hypothetical protein